MACKQGHEHNGLRPLMSLGPHTCVREEIRWDIPTTVLSAGVRTHHPARSKKPAHSIHVLSLSVEQVAVFA